MAPPVGPWFHELFTGLGKGSYTRDLLRLADDVEARFRARDLDPYDAQLEITLALTEQVLEAFKLTPSHPQAAVISKLVSDLLRFEQLFVMPEIDRGGAIETAECWTLSAELKRQQALLKDLDGNFELVRLALCHLLNPLYKACPSLIQKPDGDGITVPAHMLRLIPKLGTRVEQMAKVFFAPELADAKLFERSRGTMERNVVAASGGNPRDVQGFNRQPKHASKSDITDPGDLVETYLGGTPLTRLFEQQASFTIPTGSRFEHHHIVAGSGHGKTQTLQYLIADDIKAVAKGERSVVVLDSQGDLIKLISNLEVFAPGQPLHERIVIIDPTDVEWPVSLNLFDVGLDRLSGYAPLERERLTNSILELYDFVLGTLLSAEMTQKQSVIFRYVTRLMLHIPGATIHTLRELMEPGAEVTFAPHIAKLSGTARHFFETEFSSKEFEQTKRQVLRRLWGILENQTFERMFSHPKSKLDLYAEMNAGKVILINTAKDLLKESGTQIFGRFFIAMIAQAAQERATIPEKDRMPTFVYIDEAADYFDRNIGIILSQARKYAVGMVLAHQYLGQLDPKLLDAFSSNTTVKFAGGVSLKDARALSGEMRCDPGFIESQPKLSFAAFIKGGQSQAVPLQFPYGFMESLPSMSPYQRDKLQERMRALHAVHYTTLDGHEEAGGIVPGDVPETKPADDPTKPTSSW